MTKQSPSLLHTIHDGLWLAVGLLALCWWV